MKEKILSALANLEKEHGVTILYACESGSRAWGFASQDSDYDVRFIYKKATNSYLSIHETKDTIEVMLEDGLLDLSGWDIKKTLKLFQKSNPPLLEWLRSPDVYIERYDFSKHLNELDYFNPENVIFHYIHMAEGQYKDYVNQKLVKFKKYFYTLRPLLCCKWILKKNEFPPMEFQKLLVLIEDKSILAIIDELLRRKMAGGEMDAEPRIELLDQYISELFMSIKNIREMRRIPPPETAKLDEIFRNVIT